MPYYYLNEKREPMGPHTPEELASLLRQGCLSCMTEVAEEGDSCWVPLEKVLEPLSLLPEEAKGQGRGRRMKARPQNLTLPPLPKEKHLPGRCPSCGEELSMSGTSEAPGVPEVPGVFGVPGMPGVMGVPETLRTMGGTLPHRCPRCRRLLNLRGRGFWEHALAPLRQYACFSGRATRAEYGCWILAVGTVLLLSLLLFTGGTIMSNMPEDVDSIGTIVQAVPPSLWSMLTMLGAGMGILTMLVCALPSLALLVRRLHDAGFSGWWLSAGAAVQAAYLLFLFLRWKAIGIFGSTEASGCQGCDEGILERLSSMDACLSQEVQAGFMLSYVLMFLLLAATCIDSTRGANRYGPSSRYPLG